MNSNRNINNNTNNNENCKENNENSSSSSTHHQEPPSSPRPSSSTSVSSIGAGGVGGYHHNQHQSQQMILAPCYYSNSLAIRQEIQRFESVHPSIYAIYDLLELIGETDGPLIAQRVREHVVCIEDSFVNSQEWTLSRSVPDLRLGVVGTISSGKSALVHRYLTGSYLQDESPEGGRFKKEVIINGQSYLLLIRDEGGPPEMQLSCWVDAVIFVFSLENEASFNAIYNYYNKMFHLRSNHDIPILLVGTQDAINENNPRVIDESRVRKLAQDLKHCTYYETCATYGLNVDKVFQNACHRIIQTKNSENSRPNTPSQISSVSSLFSKNRTSPPLIPSLPLSNISNGKYTTKNSAPISPTNDLMLDSIHNKFSDNSDLNSKPAPPPPSTPPLNSVLSNLVMKKPAILSEKPKFHNYLDNNNESNTNNNNSKMNSPTSKMIDSIELINQPNVVTSKRYISSKYSNEFKVPEPVVTSGTGGGGGSNNLEPMTSNKETNNITQTPNTTRKNRRKSNLFTPLTNKSKNDDKYKNGEVGSGRTIPIKQGYLYKKSKKTLNKDWKKKYVTLTTDGCLTYHPTLHDYMDDVHGKNISLKHTTVKIPGQKPRCAGQRVMCNSPSNNIVDSNIAGGGGGGNNNERRIPSTNPKYDPSSGKKRSRKIKNVGSKNGENGEDSDGNEFVIVSLDNKQWHFNANNNEEREEWISAIEQQILSSLQNSEYDKSKIHNVNSVDDSTIHSIRTVPGNKYCVDCEAPNPDWASLNLGALICIECSGIHRNLGTHISKVRSLGLDVWPSSHVSVMLGLGNTAVNEIWEYNLNNKKLKPTPTSKHEDKEKYIRSKYVQKEFLAPINDRINPIQQQLIDSVLKMDIKSVVLLLAHASLKSINLSQICSRDKKTLLHLAASRGCLEITQLLIWHNVNDKAIDNEGKTALFYARIAGHKEIEELLNSNSNETTKSQTSNTGTGTASSGGGGYLNNQIKTNQNQQTNSSNLNSRNDNIPLNFKNIEIFNKLPASII